MSTLAPDAATGALTPGAPTAPPPAPVLLAEDGRAQTDAASIAARRAAERLGAPVEVLAVLEPLPVYTLGYEVPVVAPGFEGERRDELYAAVRHRLELVLGAREDWHLDVRYGVPGRVIPEVGRERHAALVVVGSGTHRPIERVLGDEVALQVVRRASAPVLVVAPGPFGAIRRAVVAVDFGAASVRAARTALALLDPAPGAPACLTLLHVRPTLDALAPVPAAWEGEYDAAVAARFATLRDLLRPDVPDGVTVETRIRAGTVVDVLLETAEETGADLVAVGSRGPGWVERLVVGSVATTTLRRAGRAGRTVLVAPTPDAAERVRLELRIAGQVALERPDDWAAALDALTRRNLMRRARLEVSDPALGGLAVEAAWYRFAGAAYDPHDGRVEIMLGDDAPGGRHLTHAVAGVRGIEIVAEDDRRDLALLVEDERGHAVLTFAD